MPVLTEKQAIRGENFGAFMGTQTTKTYVPPGPRAKTEDDGRSNVQYNPQQFKQTLTPEQIAQRRQEETNNTATTFRKQWEANLKTKQAELDQTDDSDPDSAISASVTYKGPRFNPTVENNNLPALKAHLENLAPKDAGLVESLTYGNMYGDTLEKQKAARKEFIYQNMRKLLEDNGFAVVGMPVDEDGNYTDNLSPHRPVKDYVPRVLLPDANNNYQFVDFMDDGSLTTKIANWATTNAFSLAIGLGADIATIGIMNKALQTGTKLTKFTKVTGIGAAVGVAADIIGENIDEHLSLKQLAEYGLSNFDAAHTASNLEKFRYQMGKFTDFWAFNALGYIAAPYIGATLKFTAKPAIWSYNKMFGTSNVKNNLESVISTAGNKVEGVLDKVSKYQKETQDMENDMAKKIMNGESLESSELLMPKKQGLIYTTRKGMANIGYKVSDLPVIKNLPGPRFVARTLDPDIQSRFFFSTMKSLPTHFELTGKNTSYLADTREAMKNVGMLPDNMSDSEKLITQLMLTSRQGVALMKQVIPEFGTAGQNTANAIKSAITARNMQFAGFAKELRSYNGQLVDSVDTIQATKGYIETFMEDHLSNTVAFNQTISEIVKRNHPTSGIIKTQFGNFDTLKAYKLRGAYTPKNMSIAEEYQDIVQSLLESKLPHKVSSPIGSVKKETTYSNRNDLDMFATTRSYKAPEHISFDNVLDMAYDLASVANPTPRVNAFSAMLQDIIHKTLRQSNIAEKDLGAYVSLLNQTYLERSMINSFEHMPFYSKLFDKKNRHSIDTLVDSLYKTATSVKITDSFADLNSVLKIVETKDPATAQQLQGLILESVFKDVARGDKNYSKMDMVNLVSKLEKLHGYSSQEKSMILDIAKAQAKFWVNEDDIVKALKDVKVTKQQGPGLTKNLISKAQFETASKVFGYIKFRLSPELQYQQSRIISKFVDAIQSPMDANVVNSFNRMLEDAKKKTYPEVVELAQKLEQDFSTYSSLYNQKDKLISQFTSKLDENASIEQARELASELMQVTKQALGVEEVSRPKTRGNKVKPNRIPSAVKADAFNIGKEGVASKMDDMTILQNIYTTFENQQGMSYDRVAALNDIVKKVNKVSKKRKLPEVTSQMVEELIKRRHMEAPTQGIDLDLSADAWLQARNVNYADTFEDNAEQTMANTLNLLHKQKGEIKPETISYVLENLERHFSNIDSPYAKGLLQDIANLKPRVGDTKFIQKILEMMEN